MSLAGPVMTVRRSVPLLCLVLVALCRAEFPPPTVNISLDEHPEVRWAPLLKVFDADYLRKAGAEVIE